MAAADVAQEASHKTQHLPSAHPRSPLVTAFWRALSALLLPAGAAAVWASFRAGPLAQLVGAAAALLLVVSRGYRKRSLSGSGAGAALLVGFGSLASSFRAGTILLAFYAASSALTRYKEHLKDDIDEAAKAGGQRDWKQVACNGAVPAACAVAFGALTGRVDLPLGVCARAADASLLTALQGGFLGYFACCCADTWASELGVLSEEQPHLITTFRPVRRGTNGAVTRLGLGASLAGGLWMGLVAYVAGVGSPHLVPGALELTVAQWALIPLGAACGLFGSLLDSVLGATVQFSGINVESKLVTSTPGEDVAPISGLPFLTNNAVNLVSATTTAALCSWLAVRLFVPV